MDFYHIADFNPKKPYIYKSVCFDAHDGTGSTGESGNVNYRGIVIFMPPQNFLKAAHKRHGARESEEFFRSILLSQEHCISPPQLYLSRAAGSWWEVTGHEGRHRSSAMSHLGVNLIPVHVELRDNGETRARNIDREVLRSLFDLIENEDRDDFTKLNILYIVLNQEVLVYCDKEDVDSLKEYWELNAPEYIDTEKQKTPRDGNSYYWWSKPKSQ